MRHAFSNAFYEAGEGKFMVELARVTGHRDLRILLDNYLSRTDEHVKAAHDSYSPIDVFATLWEVERKKASGGETSDEEQSLNS